MYLPYAKPNLPNESKKDYSQTTNKARGKASRSMEHIAHDKTQIKQPISFENKSHLRCIGLSQPIGRPKNQENHSPKFGNKPQ